MVSLRPRPWPRPRPRSRSRLRSRFPLRFSPSTRVWLATALLVASALLAIGQVARTGAPLPVVVVAVGALAYLVYATWRDGGEHTLTALGARPLTRDTVPAVHDAVGSLASEMRLATPRVEAVLMDAPGAIVGRDDGVGVVAIDPRLPGVMDERALRAVLAHELGHLVHGTLPMALRRYAPPVCGYAAFWTVLLAGAGPAPAALGSVLFFASMFPSTRTAALVRYAMGLGVEPLLLLVDRYASRQTELLADEVAADVTSPAALAEALCRIAATATGTDEDVTGPIPFTADRSWWSALWATHPSIETRIAGIDGGFPEWVVGQSPAPDPQDHPNRQ